MSENKKWTNEEIEYLKDRFYTSNIKEISKYLDRSEKAIGTKAAELGLVYRNLRKWTQNEVEFLKENYKIYGTKYCAEQLERTYDSVNRKAINLNLDGPKNKLIYREKQIKNAVKNAICLADVMKNLGLSPKGGNYAIIKKYIAKYNINTSHFDQYKRNREYARNELKQRNKKSLNELLTNGSKITSSKLKEKLYEEGLKERKCELCGQGEEWNGMAISLILDHINGVNNDNRIKNLRIVCPNCNAGLPTHCRNQSDGNDKYFENKNNSKNQDFDKIKENQNKSKKKSPTKTKNTQTTNKKTKKVEKHEEERKFNGGLTDKEIEYQKKNRKVERPSYEQLIRDINELGYLQTGKKYGVSDNAVRKWKRWYENYENVG